MNKLVIFATALALSACGMTTFNSATSNAICTSWQGVTFLPSRLDTPETVKAVTLSNKTQEAACKGLT